jgi:tetratricopeptide (TPR) repeat protein
LLHALERFPDDVRLKMAQIVAWTWGRDQESIRNVRSRGMRNPWTRVSAPQLEAVKAYEALVNDSRVGAEARVRIGLVHFSMDDFGAALASFHKAEPQATDTRMQYLAVFNAARALEQLNRPDDAAQHYAKALSIIPSAESATIGLASLQFARDERESAVALLNTRFSARARQDDPGRLMGYGSFIYLDDLIAEMHAELGR